MMNNRGSALTACAMSLNCLHVHSIPLIQSRIVHLSLAYCTRSNRSFTITLPSNIDHFPNFVTVKYATI